MLFFVERSDGQLFNPGVDALDLFNDIGNCTVDIDREMNMYCGDDVRVYVEYKAHLMKIARANRRLVEATWKLIVPTIEDQVSKLRGVKPAGFERLTSAKSGSMFVSRLMKLICDL